MSPIVHVNVHTPRMPSTLETHVAMFCLVSDYIFVAIVWLAVQPLCFVGHIFPLFKMCHIFLLIAWNLGFMTKQNKTLQMFRTYDLRPCQSIFLLGLLLPSSFVALELQLATN